MSKKQQLHIQNNEKCNKTTRTQIQLKKQRKKETDQWAKRSQEPHLAPSSD